LKCVICDIPAEYIFQGDSLCFVHLEEAVDTATEYTPTPSGGFNAWNTAQYE